MKLRGACIHSDNGPLGAVSWPAAEERRVRLLKEAGFNAIRSAHNPMSTALLDACDRLGMLVMDETFDMWTSGKSDYDYSFDFAAVVGARRRGNGRQGLQPPERDLLLDRQRDPRDGQPDRLDLAAASSPRRCAPSTAPAT